MKMNIILSLWTLGMFIAGCKSSFRVLKPEQEKNFRLSDYPTYGFYDIEATGDTSGKTFEQNAVVIKEAISRNLKARGLNEEREPALKINIAIAVKEEVQTRETDFRTEGLLRYMGQRRYSWKSEEVVTGRYKEGTMLIELVDAANDKMVWKGGSEGILPNKNKNLPALINQAIGEIFTKIPD